MAELKGQELCNAYLTEIRRVKGDECADKSRVDYDKGWYYVKIAQKAHDGSWSTWGTAPAYRAHDIIARIKMLQGKASYEIRESQLAKTYCRVVEKGKFSLEVCYKWDEQLDTYYIESYIPGRRLAGILDMQDLRDVLNRAIEIAEGMKDE